jgi:hypothetical protein
VKKRDEECIDLFHEKHTISLYSPIVCVYDQINSNADSFHIYKYRINIQKW